MKENTLTAHSECLPLESVFIAPVSGAFESRAKISSEWKSLNYLSEPDLEEATQEYRAFEELLARWVPNIHYFPSGEGLSLDAVYSRDASIATDAGIILCNMGKAARQKEPEMQARLFQKEGIPILGKIEAPGTLEGGDVAWLDQHTLAVGRSYRTNAEGIQQLKTLLAPLGVQVVVAELPHFRGPSDVFHLMSILSPLDKDLALVYSPLMPISFREGLIKRGYTLVEVPESEFDSLGCNVLAVAPRICIMAKGNPLTEAALKKAGCQVHTYKGTEISLKGGGGPTCLTRPLKRRF